MFKYELVSYIKKHMFWFEANPFTIIISQNFIRNYLSRLLSTIPASLTNLQNILIKYSSVGSLV